MVGDRLYTKLQFIVKQKNLPECYQQVEKISSDANEWSLFADGSPETHIGATEALERIKVF